MRISDWSSDVCSSDLAIHAVPAAHPLIERDTLGHLRYVGYVIEHRDRRLYLAGDTSVVQELIDRLDALKPIATASLHVNDHNFFRGRRGIISNISVREAFQFADELGMALVVQVHWDMFAANAMGVDETRAVYAHMQHRFLLHIQ